MSNSDKILAPRNEEEIPEANAPKGRRREGLAIIALIALILATLYASQVVGQVVGQGDASGASQAGASSKISKPSPALSSEQAPLQDYGADGRVNVELFRGRAMTHQ
jgi:flagellar basal body-associated protein FliL